MSKTVLIVDDNDKYALVLSNFFEAKNYIVTRAYTAREGWDIFQKKSEAFDFIITDITMETQTSGLWLARQIYKTGVDFNLCIATTGFDVKGVMRLGFYTMPWFCGLKWMIPKVPLKSGKVEFYPTSLTKNSKLLF
jgi:CheY-like chemotaxis protein